MADPNGSRTHEPELRELTADLDGLRELVLSKLGSMREVIEERDRLYKERDDSRRTAVDAALTAVKEQTKASFEASEKAIVKAEEAQKSYNQSHNDLARKMDEQNKATMPRSETEQRFRGLEEKINEVRTVVATGGGQAQGARGVKEESRANMAIIIATVGVLLGLIPTILSMMRIGKP